MDGNFDLICIIKFALLEELHSSEYALTETDKDEFATRMEDILDILHGGCPGYAEGMQKGVQDMSRTLFAQVPMAAKEAKAAHQDLKGLL
eukprot:7449162-Pyramimonas_sp.AAC.1